MSSITEMVRDKYGAVARSGLSNDLEAVKSVAAAFGYSADELFRHRYCVSFMCTRLPPAFEPAEPEVHTV